MVLRCGPCIHSPRFCLRSFKPHYPLWASFPEKKKICAHSNLYFSIAYRNQVDDTTWKLCSRRAFVSHEGLFWERKEKKCTAFTSCWVRRTVPHLSQHTLGPFGSVNCEFFRNIFQIHKHGCECWALMICNPVLGCIELKLISVCTVLEASQKCNVSSMQLMTPELNISWCWCTPYQKYKAAPCSVSRLFCCSLSHLCAQLESTPFCLSLVKTNRNILLPSVDLDRRIDVSRGICVFIINI